MSVLLLRRRNIDTRRRHVPGGEGFEYGRPALGVVEKQGHILTTLRIPTHVICLYFDHFTEIEHGCIVQGDFFSKYRQVNLGYVRCILADVRQRTGCFFSLVPP